MKSQKKELKYKDKFGNQLPKEVTPLKRPQQRLQHPLKRNLEQTSSFVQQKLIKTQNQQQQQQQQQQKTWVYEEVDSDGYPIEYGDGLNVDYFIEQFLKEQEEKEEEEENKFFDEEGGDENGEQFLTQYFKHLQLQSVDDNDDDDEILPNSLPKGHYFDEKLNLNNSFIFDSNGLTQQLKYIKL